MTQRIQMMNAALVLMVAGSICGADSVKPLDNIFTYEPILAHSSFFDHLIICALSLTSQSIYVRIKETKELRRSALEQAMIAQTSQIFADRSYDAQKASYADFNRSVYFMCNSSVMVTLVTRNTKPGFLNGTMDGPKMHDLFCVCALSNDGEISVKSHPHCLMSVNEGNRIDIIRPDRTMHISPSVKNGHPCRESNELIGPILYFDHVSNKLGHIEFVVKIGTTEIVSLYYMDELLELCKKPKH